MTNDNNLMPIKFSILAILAVFSLATLSLASNFFTTSSSKQPSVQVQQPVITISAVTEIGNNSGVEQPPAVSTCYTVCVEDSDCLENYICAPVSCQDGVSCNLNLVCQNVDCPNDNSCSCSTNNLQKPIR